jgi:hypothetical protein
MISFEGNKSLQPNPGVLGLEGSGRACPKAIVFINKMMKKNTIVFLMKRD